MDKNVSIDQSGDRLIKRMAKGGGIVFAGIIIGKLCTTGLHILLSRTLGATEYGLYALGYSAFIVVSRVCLLGLPVGVLRFIALQRGENDERRIKGTALSGYIIALLFSILVALLLYFNVDFFAVRIFKKPQLADALRIFVSAMPFFAVMAISYSIFRGFQKMGFFVLFRDIFRPALNIMIAAVVFLLGYRLKGALFSFWAAVGFAALISLFFMQRKIPLVFSRIKPIYEIKKLLRFSMPVLFIGFSLILINQVSRLVLGYFEYSDDVGIYNAAATITVLILIFLNCIDAIFAPIISNLFNHKRYQELSRLYKTSTRWVFSFSFPASLLYIIFADKIMSLFGRDFVAGSKAMIILTVAYLLNSITGSVAFLLQMSGKQDLELVNCLSMVTLSIILNIILVKEFGLIGAAVASGISISAINLIRLAEVKKILKMQPYDRKFLKPITAGIIMLFIWLVGISRLPIDRIFWPFLAAGLFLLYFGLMFLFGLEKDDKLVFESIKKSAFKTINSISIKNNE